MSAPIFVPPHRSSETRPASATTVQAAGAAHLPQGDRIGGIRAAFADLDLTDPVAAFTYGLAMGQAIEREASDRNDDMVHRAAMRDVRTLIDWADQRATADQPGPRERDHHGGRASSWGPPTPRYNGAYSR
ncbi:hypothetical protein [Asanoa iriomotensis]|uniref:Uncharacterized protein n=1 Tax=Asanoa iriomotensis TaxID=234613 RepID=A0ABQ4C7J8_9ACTN|nr:hypothetical protein [Asanoa iriomotensis]GIF58763.1 hypothetical protein Air01nite_48580 [Asanoa iriomotensis]